MPRQRFIEYRGERWRISRLAEEFRMPVGTLARRLERFGETTTGIHRALATGILSRAEVLRKARARSPWT